MREDQGIKSTTHRDGFVLAGTAHHLMMIIQFLLFSVFTCQCFIGFFFRIRHFHVLTGNVQIYYLWINSTCYVFCHGGTFNVVTAKGALWKKNVCSEFHLIMLYTEFQSQAAICNNNKKGFSGSCYNSLFKLSASMTPKLFSNQNYAAQTEQFHFKRKMLSKLIYCVKIPLYTETDFICFNVC